MSHRIYIDGLKLLADPTIDEDAFGDHKVVVPPPIICFDGHPILQGGDIMKTLIFGCWMLQVHDQLNRQGSDNNDE